MITQEYLREFFEYDPESGKFTRTHKLSWKGNKVKAQTQPSSKTAYGYLQISVKGKPYVAHRLIWVWMTGEFPKNDIDHINGNRTDNRWCNLRAVTRKQNLRNIGIKTNNTSGYLGISKRSDTGKWYAYINKDGNRKSLGCFELIGDALEARQQAERELAFHENHGKRESWRG